MADAVTSQTISNNVGKLVMKFTNVSDGTGEAAVTKVDVLALTPAADEVTIEKIIFATTGMGVDIFWDADTDVLAWHVPANQSQELCFDTPHAITNNAGAGKTGDIKFTTVPAAGAEDARYSIVLHMRYRTA